MYNNQYEISETTEGREINFSYEFDERIEYLPDDINIIMFNNRFNNNIDWLPNQVTHIHFGNDFDKPVDNLPNGLKFVSFGPNFSHPINCLPDSVEEIKVTQHYNSQDIKKLPKSLKIFNVCRKPKIIFDDTQDCVTSIDESIPNYYEIYSELEEKYSNVKFYY